MTHSDAPRFSGLRVLVVEDDEDLLGLFESHLYRLGCTVRGIATGEEALAAAREYAPQVAIIDLRLPGMTGEQVIQQLRSDPTTTGCRIMVSSVLDKDAYPPTADAVLPKPFSRQQFETVLATLVTEQPE